MHRSSFCKKCCTRRTCEECRRIKREGEEFAARFSLDALTLIAYTDWRSLPNSSGIYFAFGSLREVIYIGQTQNLYARWLCGNYRSLYQYGVQTIGFVLTPDVILFRLSAERELINRFQPSTHGIRKSAGPKLREWEQLVKAEVSTPDPVQSPY